MEANYNLIEAMRFLHNVVVFKAQKKGIELKFEMDENIPSVLFGDELRIRQILLNLINNAIKYTEQGFIRFSMMIDAITNQMVVLKVTTTDTGKGIKEEDQKQLFDAFQRVDVKNNELYTEKNKKHW